MAAGVAAGRGAGGATAVLAEAVGGDGAVGYADGSCAACSDEPAGCYAVFRSREAVEREAEGSESARRDDAVHERGGGVAGAAEQVYGAAGYCGGDGGGQPQPGGSGGFDWILCEHAGGADGDEGKSEFCGGVETGTAGDAGCLPEPGSAVREAGGGVAAGAGYEPFAIVSGDGGAAEQ